MIEAIAKPPEWQQVETGKIFVMVLKDDWQRRADPDDPCYWWQKEAQEAQSENERLRARIKTLEDRLDQILVLVNLE